MDHPPDNLFSELKRRKVFRTAAAYLAAAFVVLQVADLTFEPLGFPPAAYRALIIIVGVGFPLALLLSWFFDVQRTDFRPRMGRRVAVVFAAFLLFCSAALAYGVLRHWQRADYGDAETIAVLPFKVIGGELAYLETGIVEVLSRNIDGTAGLRAVAPDMVLTFVRKDSEPAVLSSKLAARFIVSGNVTQLGERVRITATVSDFGRDRPAVTSHVEGSVDHLFALIDQLSAQILSATRTGQDARLSRSAALTTRSLPALRAYLAGEEYYRSTKYDSAAIQFTDAVTIDSTFALAYYRLALTHAFAANFARVPDAIAKALRHAERLNARDRLLLQALAAYSDGDRRLAQARYRELLQQYPNDMEATFLLGEIIADLNPMQGKPAAEAEPLLMEVAAADPEFLCAICSLIYLALYQGEFQRADSLYRVLPPPRLDTLMYPLAHALQSGDRVRANELIKRHEEMSPWARANAAYWVQRLLHNAEIFNQLAPDPKDDAQNLTRIRTALGFGKLEQGRIREAFTEFGKLGEASSVDLSTRAVNSPFVMVPRQRLESLHAHFMASDSAPGSGSPSEQLRPHMRLYHLAVVSWRLGDLPAAINFADRLDSLPTPARWRPSMHALAEQVRAQVDLEHGRHEQALGRLEPVHQHVPPAEIGVLVRGNVVTVAAYAEALYRAGRYEEAKQYFDNLPFIFGYHSPVVAHFLLRRAQIAEALGQPEAARNLYVQFLALFVAPDAEMQHYAEQARRSLAALQRRID